MNAALYYLTRPSGIDNRRREVFGIEKLISGIAGDENLWKIEPLKISLALAENSIE